MGWTIRWLRDRVGRSTGHVETWGQEETLKKWLAEGWVELLDGKSPGKIPPPAATAPARGMGLRSFDGPPHHRAIQAPVKKNPVKAKTKRKMRKGRR